MLDTIVKPDTFLYIALNAWVPAFATVLLGGFAVSIIVPRVQRRYQRYQIKIDKKAQLCEDVARAFGRYVVSWRRLRVISELESDRPLNAEETERKKGFVVERNERRDDLLDSLRVCKLYSCAAVCNEIDRFMLWDEQQAALPLSDLASIQEWRMWEEQLIKLLRQDVR